MDQHERHQLAAAYLDACQWAETQTADTLRVLAALANRTLDARGLRAFERDITESSKQWRARVDHAQAALQRAQNRCKG